MFLFRIGAAVLEFFGRKRSMKRVFALVLTLATALGLAAATVEEVNPGKMW